MGVGWWLLWGILKGMLWSLKTGFQDEIQDDRFRDSRLLFSRLPYSRLNPPIQILRAGFGLPALLCPILFLNEFQLKFLNCTCTKACQVLKTFFFKKKYYSNQQVLPLVKIIGVPSPYVSFHSASIFKSSLQNLSW